MKSLFLFFIFFSAPIFADGLTDLQDDLDLKFCIEYAGYARKTVIPVCSKQKPKSKQCVELLVHFYRAKCERWGL